MTDTSSDRTGTAARVAVLLVAVMVVGAAAMAVTAGAQSQTASDEGDLQSVTAEVTGETWFGNDAREVTFEYEAAEGTEVEFEVVGEASTTATADGTPSSAELDVGNIFSGTSYPISVVVTAGDQVCTATIERGDGAVDVCEDGGDATFDSASAEVTKETWFSNDARKVTFTYETDAGTPVEFTVDGEHTRSTVADGTESQKTVRVGTLFSGAEYPLEVEASTPAETVGATINAGDGEVTLVERDEPEPPQLESIDLQLDDDTLTEGETTEASVEATYDDGSTEDVTSEAAISGDDLASVDGSTVTAESAGDATISADYEGQSDTATLTVEPAEPDPPTLESIDLQLADDTLTEGETTQASVEATYDDGSTEDVSADATISGDDLASVDGTTVTAESAGDATITADYEGQSDTATLTVEPGEPEPPTLESIDLQLADDTLTEGETTQATVEATYDDGSTEDVTSEAAISGDDLASVDGSTVTAESAGDATITADYEGQSDTAALTVESADDGPITADSFTAYGQTGTIVLADQTDDPIQVPECDQDQPLPENAPDQVIWAESCFEINGEIDHESGTWSADPSDVSIPLITSTDVGSADSADVQLSAPDGFSGDVDLETGELTINGDLVINAQISTALGEGECETSMALESTTGESEYGLTGSPLSVDESAGTATGTVVDDRFTVPGFEELSGVPLVDVCGQAESQYGLPAQEAGTNSFEMDTWVQFHE